MEDEGRPGKVLGLSDIYKIGLGYLGLTEEELENSTFATFNYRYAGHMEREYMDWERTRTLAAWLLQPHVGKGKTVKPTDLISLPHDGGQQGETQPTKFTEEEKARIEEARIRYLQSKNKTK